MKEYLLEERFVSMSLFFSLEETGGQEGIVNYNNEVIIKDRKLTIRNGIIKPKTKVWVYFRKFFYCKIDHKKILKDKIDNF